MTPDSRIARRRFEAIAAGPDEAIRLDEAALWIAAESQPELDVGAYLGELDRLAELARPTIAQAASLADRAAALNDFLFREERFTGNRGEYYDPRNSYLNHVLDRRTGIPITLSLVYIAVALRLGCDVQGVGFPGHFLLKWAGPAVIVVDAFEGCLLSERDCQQRLDRALGRHIALRPELHLRAAAPREILTRMLGNLKQIFVERRDWLAALDCSERTLLLYPEAAQERRDRGLVLEQLGCLAAAKSELEGFLEQAPDDPSAPAVRKRIESLSGRMPRLH